MKELSLFILILILFVGYLMLFFKKRLQTSIISFHVASVICFLYAFYMMLFVVFDVLEKNLGVYVKLFTVVSMFFILIIAVGFATLARYCCNELEKEKNAKSKYYDRAKTSFDVDSLSNQEPVSLIKAREEDLLS